MSESIQEREAVLRPSADLTETLTILRELIKAHQNSSVRSRERSLIITKLEEAESWAVKAGATEPVDPFNGGVDRV